MRQIGIVLFLLFGFGAQAAPGVSNEARLASLEAQLEQLSRQLKQVESERPRDITHFKLPKELSFCGERISLTSPEVRERLEMALFLLLNDRPQVLIWWKRAQRAFPVIEKEIASIGQCDDLKFLAVVESGLRSKVVSSASAAGWWQFMKPTGKAYGLATGGDWDERSNLTGSTRAAISYLSALHERFGRWELAMAAYNTGPGRLARAQQEQGVEDYWSLDLYSEAERYVPRILLMKEILAHPERYDFDFEGLEGWGGPAPGSVSINIPHGARLKVTEAAQGGRVSYRGFRLLNPELGTAYLPTGKKVDLKVPVGNEKHLGKWLNQEIVHERDRLKRQRRQAERRKKARRATAKKRRKRGKKGKRYTIRSGDSLWSIAKKYGVTIASLKSWNELPANVRIQAGQALVVKPR